MNKVEDQELKRNGEGYLDLTAHHAIKHADKDYDDKKKIVKHYSIGPNEKPKAMTLPMYKKRKLKILNELGIELSSEEELHLKSLKTECDIDKYAHRLIMTKE